MSDSLRRQLQQRLESLRAAGVEYLPRGEGLPAGLTPAAPTRAPAPVVRPAESQELAKPHPPGVRESAPESVVPRLPEPGPIISPRAETPAVSAADVESRRTELTLLAKQVSQCSRCAELSSTRTQTVFGVGPLDPDLCFIGEAPGGDEDRLGEPFVGAAGQLLDRIIAGALGMKREEVFICNILRCRPPGNRPPQATEAANCREWLEQTLKLVRPRHICCLGASAAKFLLSVNLSIGRMRKKFHSFDGIPVICTYHPSYLLRLREPDKTEGKREVWEDMKMLLAKMGREDPSAKKTS